MSSDIKANAEAAEQMKNAGAESVAPLADEVLAAVGGGSFFNDLVNGVDYITNPIGSTGQKIYQDNGGSNPIVGDIIGGAGGMVGHF